MNTTQKLTGICGRNIAHCALGASTPVMAQSSVTSADIQRLQDEVYQASADVSRLRTTDALAAGRLQDELDALREDVIYLKVKLRSENNVSRTEYTDIRSQLEGLRSRARGDSRSNTTSSASADSNYPSMPPPTPPRGSPAGRPRSMTTARRARHPRGRGAGFRWAPRSMFACKPS